MATTRKQFYEHRHRKNAEKTRRAQAVGKRLQDRREELGLGISELAKRCGWDASRIWKYETGHALPGHDAIACLSRELGISKDELLALATGEVTGEPAGDVAGEPEENDQEGPDHAASGSGLYPAAANIPVSASEPPSAAGTGA